MVTYRCAPRSVDAFVFRIAFASARGSQRHQRALRMRAAQRYAPACTTYGTLVLSMSPSVDDLAHGSKSSAQPLRRRCVS
jgi:hypothetical protein